MNKVRVILFVTLALGTLGLANPSKDSVRETKRAAVDDGVTPESVENPALPTTSSTGEVINWQVLSGGGTEGSSANFRLMGTTGQTAVGPASSASFILSHGFWHDFDTWAACCMLRGDLDRNSQVDILDIDNFIDWLFRDGVEPGCFEDADADANHQLDILDIDYLIDWLFREGPEPVPCP